MEVLKEIECPLLIWMYDFVRLFGVIGGFCWLWLVVDIAILDFGLLLWN
jgi:hypothetical protein